MFLLRKVSVVVVAGILIVLLLQGYSLGGLLTPSMARPLRIANVTTGLTALVGLAAFTAPAWGDLNVPQRDWIFGTMLLLFITTSGAGQALQANLPPNDLAIAVLFAHVGGLRMLWLWHAFLRRYGVLRPTDSAPAHRPALTVWRWARRREARRPHGRPFEG